MRRKRRYSPVLFLGLLSLIGLLFYILFIDPSKGLSLGNIFISPIILFFILLITSISCIGSYVFTNIRRGILLGVFLSLILLLRFFGFASYLYIVILAVIVLLLELGFRKH